MAAQPDSPLQLDQEVEGDLLSSSDFAFRRLGEAVPLKPTGSAFDLKDLPFHPLAVSERSGALFLAHSEGFLVARTKDVIGIAKEIKSKGSGPCIQESSITDVQIGRVSIVALSSDSSTLAAVVGRDIRFFTVESLLNKVQDSFFSCSLDGAGVIKDFKWRKGVDESFIVLSSHSLLYHGSLKDQLKDVMDNVDAVDWSVEGDFVAVARKNTVNILSHDFRKQNSMSLLFKSWPDEAGLECNMKVDSINWVCANSIVVGCVRLDEDGNEDGYLVQVITTKKEKFAEKSCMPVVYSFPDLFGSIADDILLVGGVSYLLSSYLDRWKIILASNKKAYDNHVVLLQLLVDDKAGEVASLEFRNDMSPRIDLQENGDDNFILGIGIDKISLYEKVRLQVGSEIEERSPYCILMCLTCEGKLIMFHAVRISDSLDLPSLTLPPPDDSGSMLGKGKTSSVSSDNALLTTSSKLADAAQSLVSNVKLSPTTSDVRDGYTGKEFSFANLELPKDSQSSVPSGKQDQVGGSMGQIASKIEFPAVVKFSSSGPGGSSTLVVGNIPAESSAKKSSETSKELALIGTPGTSVGSQSTRGLQVGVNPSVKSPEFLFSKPSLTDEQKKTEIQRGEKLHVPSHSSASAASAYHLPSGGPFSFKGFSKDPSPLMFPSNKTAPSEGHSTSAARTGTSESVPLLRRSTVMSQEGSLPTRSLVPSMQPAPSSSFKRPQVNCEADMSKQFYNVKDMVKELDTLLSSIDQEGGFMESCATLQRNSSLALNESLGNIFEMSRKCKSEVEEKLMEIQQLQHKMLQISSRQAYMEGIFKQASNDQYWHIWNHQKLSPEFELKRDNILSAYENLTSQVIELERHFDSLEINRFGESGRAVVGRRTSQRSLEPSRQTQSLHSIYNTLSSQLAAAQQLSECLSKQMAVLNLSSPSVRRQNVAKELFESIGLTHGASAIQSPDFKKHVASSEYINRISASRSPSPSKAIKELPGGNTPSTLKSATPKTARRWRDSLDRSLLSFEPQKTTVKRMLQRRLRDSADTPFRTHAEASSLPVAQPRHHEAQAFSSQSRMNKFRADAHEIQEKPSKQALAQSNYVFKWATNNSLGSSHSLGSNSHPTLVDRSHSLGSNSHPTLVDRSTQPSLPMMPSPSIYSVSQNNGRESSSSPDKTIADVTHFGGQSNSSVKSVSVSKTMLNTQFVTSDPIQTSLSGRPTQTGKGQTCQQLNSGVTSSLQRSTQDKGQTSGQLSPKTAEEGLTRSLQRSTKDFAGSTVSSPANVGDGNISALSPVSALPSVGNFDKVVNRKDTTETSSADTEVSVPTTPFFSTPTASTTSFTISTSVKSSSPATLFSISAVEGTSVDNKTIGEARGAALVFPSLLATSSQSTSSSTGLSSFRSETPPNLAYPVERSPSQPLPTQPIELSSTTESTVGQAPLSDASLGGINSQHKPVKSELPLKEISDGLFSKAPPSLLSNSVGGMFPATSSSSPQISSDIIPTTTGPTTGKVEGDVTFSQEDEMEEEAPDTASMLNLGALGGFGLGSAPPSTAPKSNPFGGSFVTSAASSMSSFPSHSASPGQLFRPASLNIPSLQPIQQAQAVNSSGQASGFSGFGQPAQLGAGQKALGSVLGSFGQSRQLGAGVPGFGFAPAGGFGSGGISASGGGGFADATQGGGFAGAAQGGGFAAAAQGGGFAGASQGGGFAAAAQGGGFAGASQGGGFAAAAQGGGFAGAAQGGGFAGAAQGGGFAAAAQGGGFAAGAAQGGGFAGAAPGGGFAAAAQGGGFGGAAPGGGFAAAASGGGGFSGAAAGGFGGAAQGGSFGAGAFGAFSSNQGSGFSAFGGGAAKPPPGLLNQMRK